MAEKTTRTIYGMYLQTCAHMGLPFVVYPNTTLNEKLGVQAGKIPDAGVYPTVGYLSLGNGGLKSDVSGDGTLVMVPKIFNATNASPYNPLPLVLRPLGNDLDPATRAKYALRRIETRNNVPYIAYYLKRLDKTGLTASMNLTTVVNGVKSTVPFSPDSSVLNPVPPAISTPGVITADGTYVNASAPLGIVLDANDIAELMNVFDIIYQNPHAAIISEAALCSGVDLTVQVTDQGGSTFNMAEAIAVQVNDLVNVGAPLEFNSDGVKWNLDMGATEPLFKTQITQVKSA